MPPQKAIAKNASFETVLYSAVKIPGIKINRDNFLQKELSRYFNRSVVRKAIETNPAQAGISQEHLEKIAKACINFETTKVTAISS
ncbi:MAG: hypothetical protein FWG06_01875, partial [Clostridiales bacterium]|nr:hypothetical protein [Clostridiales bacterium]